MVCKICGKMVDDETDVCPLCGNRLNVPEDVENVQSDMGSAETKNNTILPWVILGVGVVCVAAFIILAAVCTVSLFGLVFQK